ncbi:uncharacterized protein [Typha latifolia]|uniref:uncharacterized protein n=1 Tax=Typha latifolia TaxID=4733 RepID=UPI003C2C1EE1
MATTITTHCLVILLLCYFFHCSSAAHHNHHDKNHLPSAMVVGTVYCDTCFLQEFSKTSRFISGASVGIKCGDAFQKEVLTNRRGEFRVHLPLEVIIKTCSVKLIKSSDPYCSVASPPMTNGLRHKARRNGVHVYSAGLFTFKPLTQPELCNQKVEQPALSFPPIPTNPLQPPSFFPPNPFQPPLPFQPSPPAFPFPSFPFPPNPIFPGFPVPPGIPSNGASP